MPKWRGPQLLVSQADQALANAERLIAITVSDRMIDAAAPPRVERDFLPMREFVRAAWPQLRPEKLSWNWHMDDICDHLEAITFGAVGRFADWVPYEGRHRLTAERYERIRNTVVNVPPRSTKSIIISVCWPAWGWGEVDPSLEWLFSSYSLGLSLDHSRMCRDLIQSEWYQGLYGNRYALRDDLNTASDFGTSKRGRRQAISVGSATTGKGGHIIVTDDPHNVIDGESEADRKKVKRWFGQGFSTRLNDPATGAIVVVMQRIHQDDLAGNLLAEGKVDDDDDAADEATDDDTTTWERLIYRQEYEPEKDADGVPLPAYETALGYRDRRTEPGELLWPERFTPKVIARAKVRLGSYGYAGQHQQRPSSIEGGIFNRGWWQRYSLAAFRAIRFRKLAIFVDTAQKEGIANDYSAFLLAGIDDMLDYYFLDLWRGKVELPGLVNASYDFWHKHAKAMGKALPIVVEDTANGSALIAMLRGGEVARDPAATEYQRRLVAVRQKLPAMPFAGQKRTPAERMLARWIGFDKISRAQSMSPIVQAGRVWIPMEAEWAGAFLDETSDFPNGRNDDQVDVAAMALKWLGVDSEKTLQSSN